MLSAGFKFLKNDVKSTFVEKVPVLSSSKFSVGASVRKRVLLGLRENCQALFCLRPNTVRVVLLEPEKFQQLVKATSVKRRKLLRRLLVKIPRKAWRSSTRQNLYETCR